MKKLMSTLAIVGCTLLASFGMTSETTAYAKAETVTPENCAHNMDIEYNPANAELYNDIDMFELYMYAVENKCDVCGDMYYKYCDCDYGPALCERYSKGGKCECGADYHEIDYLVFVNDYVKYEAEACESDYWHEKERETFYCVYCEEHFDDYCDNCDNYRDVWYAYCEQYSMMNHCEDCDTDYYRYCDCNEKYEGYDYEIFAYEYDEYMRGYCTYECEEHEGVIVRYYEHCCLCEGHDDDCTDDYEEYLEDLYAIRNK